MGDIDQVSHPAIDPGLAREELDRILSSEAFRGAERQRELLVYIFEATIDGRLGDLAGKIIAENVFGIDQTSTRELSTVRVEVGRLRRRLHSYYYEDGRANAGRIDIPKGGYALTLTPAKVISPGVRWRSNRKLLLALAASFALAILGATFWMISSRLPGPVPIYPQFTESAEAYSLFFEARSIGNPPVVKSRVEAAIRLAQEIQRIDPTFAGGYAAEAVQFWNLVMFGHSEAPDVDKRNALNLARHAIETDPEFSWSQHALSQALHLNHDIFAAIEAAQRAVDLDPNEADHHGYLGLFLALSGDSAEGVEHVQEALAIDASVRTPYRNMLGIAYFADHDFDAAAQALETNRDLGGPGGPHILVLDYP